MSSCFSPISLLGLLAARCAPQVAGPEPTEPAEAAPAAPAAAPAAEAKTGWPLWDKDHHGFRALYGELDG